MIVFMVECLFVWSMVWSPIIVLRGIFKFDKICWTISGKFGGNKNDHFLAFCYERNFLVEYSSWLWCELQYQFARTIWGIMLFSTNYWCFGSGLENLVVGMAVLFFTCYEWLAIILFWELFWIWICSKFILLK